MKTCLSVVKREGFFLVILKRRGLGSGRYNLPGGKLKDDESPEQCAIRETREEVGIDLLNPRVLGKISFIHGNLRRKPTSSFQTILRVFLRKRRKPSPCGFLSP